MKPAKKVTFSNKVMFVDGMPGCGKTLFSPFLGAYPKVELLTYAYDIEQACGLHHMGELSLDAASTLVNLFVDQKTYHGMMCRETNFRPSDLSSVFKNPGKLRYFKRLFMKGDHAITQRIIDEAPILNLTVHNLLAYSLPIFMALADRVTFVEIIRHPLYQIRQHFLNTRDMYVDDPRDMTMAYQIQDDVVPYFVKGYEDEWIRGNAMDKAILSIYYWDKQVQKILEINQNIQENTVIIPFEKFVLDPDGYLEKIEQALGVERTPLVLKALKKQNVPRKRIADGIALPVYKRCGWEPPIKGTEKDELKQRYEDAEKEASDETLILLREMSEKYEAEYMQGIL